MTGDTAGEPESGVIETANWGLHISTLQTLYPTHDPGGCSGSPCVPSSAFMRPRHVAHLHLRLRQGKIGVPCLVIRPGTIRPDLCFLSGNRFRGRRWD